MRRTVPFLVFLFSLTAFRVSAALHPPPVSLALDSPKYKIMSLDSLSPEDSALLEEYKDSFLLELDDFASTFSRKKLKRIDTTVIAMDRSSHVEIGLDFCSAILSNYRVSGISGVGFTPSAMYYHKWGLYAALGMGFMTDSAVRKSAPIPLLFVSPGYYKLFFKKWSVGAAYTRSWAFYAPQNERGLLNNAMAFSTAFDFWNYITLSASAQISWSSTRGTLVKRLDEVYSTSIGLDLKKDFKIINFIGAKVFTITPEMFFLFGNDNNTFLQQRIANEIGPRRFTIQQDLFFGFLGLEPAVDIDWRIRNLEIYGAFHLGIPFNEFNNDTDVREKNPHHYYPYATAGIKYLFRVKKGQKR